jgi:hypothetical protein
MEQKELEKIAEKLYPINPSGGSMEMLSRHQLDNSLRQEGFIEGVKLMAKTMFNEEEVRRLLIMQRGNSYVAILTKTKDEELARIASTAPEPGGKDGWVKQDTLKNLENISSKNIDPEFVDIVNDNFWGLIDSSEKTLEEVADKLSDELHTVFEMNNEDAFLWILNILNKGATWQAERMYSEADMREAIVKASLSNIDDLIERCDDILRQFNKK